MTCCCLCSLDCLGSLCGVYSSSGVTDLSLLCFDAFSLSLARLHLQLTRVAHPLCYVSFPPIPLPSPLRYPISRHTKLSSSSRLHLFYPLYTLLYLASFLSCVFLPITLLLSSIGCVLDDNRFVHYKLLLFFSLHLAWLFPLLLLQQGEVRAGSQPGATREHIKYLFPWRRFFLFFNTLLLLSLFDSIIIIHHHSSWRASSFFITIHQAFFEHAAPGPLFYEGSRSQPILCRRRVLDHVVFSRSSRQFPSGKEKVTITENKKKGIFLFITITTTTFVFLFF